MMKNINNFQAGTLKQQFKYKSFSPMTINNEWNWDEPIIGELLEKAGQALGEVNAYTRIVPDVDFYITMHKVKEANTSSKIEGTNTNMDEALMDEEDVAIEKRDDWKEVHNYINAMNTGIESLERMPLSNRLLRSIHSVLMQGVRGEQKAPGEFRQSPNWIGGSNLTDAVYIPPHYSELPDLMSDLERFWHNENIHVPHLIRIAISHYQFETIHPFLDGNGRIGRLLIIIYMINFKMLNKPSLFISAFFEKRRSSYYDALSRVRESNDLAHWIKFFLNGVIETAQKASETFLSILHLKDSLEHSLMQWGRKANNALGMLKFLYNKPVFKTPDIAEALNVSISTAHSLIKNFEVLKVVKEISGKRRNKLFVFKAYLNIFLNDRKTDLSR